MRNVRKKIKIKMVNKCLDCENCEGGDFCLLKNEFIDTSPMICCDNFHPCSVGDEYNSGFSIIEPILECETDIIAIKAIVSGMFVLILDDPYFLKYEYFNNQYLYFNELLNIFSVQKTKKDLENDFSRQIVENLKSGDGDIIKKLITLTKEGI